MRTILTLDVSNSSSRTGRSSPCCVFNGGVVSHEASIPELRDTLADLLRDMKARSKAQIEELIRLKAALSAGADNLLSKKYRPEKSRSAQNG